MAHDTAAHDDTHPHANYQFIFVLLCICTILSVLFDVVPLNRRVVAVLVMAVAVAKAQFVMRYFMHLKFEGRWKYVLLLPTVILACGLPLALAPDIALHYYTPEREEAVALDAGQHAGAGGLDHGADQPAHEEHEPSRELAPGEGGDEGADQQ